MITEPASDRTLQVSIVLHQSALPLLRSTLNHLRVAAENALNSDALAHIRITLVDNASGPEYSDALRGLVDQFGADKRDSLQLELLELDDNPGFGGGHNSALLESNAEQLLILNPDVELAPDAILLAARALGEKSELVALNPRSSRSSGEPEYLCKRYPTLPVLLLRGVSVDLASKIVGKQLERYEYRPTA